MGKLLVVYNTCELAGQGAISYYVDSLRSILNQTLNNNPNNFKVAVSSCAPTPMTQIQLQNTFHKNISYNFVHGNYPVSVTFNDTVEQMTNHFGEFDQVLYVDSGVNFWDPNCGWDTLSILQLIHEGNGFGITNALVSNDDGRQWLGWDFAPGEKIYVFPYNKTCNLHVAIFDKEFIRAYKRPLVDVIASHTLESLLPIMCAAINKKMAITNAISPLHLHSLDGASSGSRATDADRIQASDMVECALLFKTKKNMDKRYQEGAPLGFGWETCKSFWQPNPECYDDNGFAKNPELQHFCAKELYLSTEEFDYAQIPRQFIAGR